MTGSSTIPLLAAELGKRYEKEHPGVRVDVQSGGSGRGIADQVAVFWLQNGTGRLIESGSVAQVFESPKDPLTVATINGTRG